MLTFALFVQLALWCTSTAAHGFVNKIGIDGVWYMGSRPGGNSQASSPIRAISDNGPVQLKGSNVQDILCGRSSRKASLVAPASPGSQVAISWSAGDGTSAWFHRVGPLITYMASCGTTPCDQFEPTLQTEWFKIAQYGQLSNDTHSWYQAQIADAKATYMFKLPENIASGGYLVRHEIISLQNAMAPNGAEFYPMCAQILIDGNGVGRPNETITLPEAYNSDNGGVIFDAYTPPVQQFKFPGGPVSNLAVTEQSMGPAAPALASVASGAPATMASTMPSPTPAMQSPTSCSDSISPPARSPGRCLVKTGPIQRHQVKRFGMLSHGLSRRLH